jgi:hypothetical protein
LPSTKYDADFPPKTEIHKLKFKELQSKLAAQQQLIAKPRLLSNTNPIILQGQQSGP